MCCMSQAEPQPQSEWRVPVRRGLVRWQAQPPQFPAVPSLHDADGDVDAARHDKVDS